MPTLKLTIGSRQYELECGRGEEARLKEVAAKLNKKVQDIVSESKVGDGMALALVALTLQDSLDEYEKDSKTGNSKHREDQILAESIEAIAGYIDQLADKLEKR